MRCHEFIGKQTDLANGALDGVSWDGRCHEQTRRSSWDGRCHSTSFRRALQRGKRCHALWSCVWAMPQDDGAGASGFFFAQGGERCHLEPRSTGKGDATTSASIGTRNGVFQGPAMPRSCRRLRGEFSGEERCHCFHPGIGLFVAQSDATSSIRWSWARA